MSDPIAAIGAPSEAQYALAITRKAHDQQDVEGKQAVQLIQSAEKPQLASSGPVGTQLNFVA